MKLKTLGLDVSVNEASKEIVVKLDYSVNYKSNKKDLVVKTVNKKILDEIQKELNKEYKKSDEKYTVIFICERTSNLKSKYKIEIEDRNSEQNPTIYSNTYNSSFSDYNIKKDFEILKLKMKIRRDKEKYVNQIKKELRRSGLNYGI